MAAALTWLVAATCVGSQRRRITRKAGRIDESELAVLFDELSADYFATVEFSVTHTRAMEVPEIAAPSCSPPRVSFPEKA
jgi:hypothetical protein